MASKKLPIYLEVGETKMSKEIKYKTIKDLLDAVKSGELDESKLSIFLDNDGVSFGYGEYDEEECEYEIDILVREASGYSDIEPLYKLLFPKAKVEWV